MINVKHYDGFQYGNFDFLKFQRQVTLIYTVMCV